MKINLLYYAQILFFVSGSYAFGQSLRFTDSLLLYSKKGDFDKALEFGKMAESAIKEQKEIQSEEYSNLAYNPGQTHLS